MSDESLSLDVAKNDIQDLKYDYAPEKEKRVSLLKFFYGKWPI